nr:uncharacterized protein LOC107281173 isoform X2 [Oryza sativa Japonica Group]
MPAIGRSPSSEHFRPSPRATTFASTRQIHSLTFPFLFPSELSHHRRPLYRPKPSSSTRRSGQLLPLSASHRLPRVRVAREHAWPPPSKPFHHQSTGAPPPSLFSVAGKKEKKKGTGGRRRRRKRKRKTDSKDYYLLDGNLWYFENRIIRLPILDSFALEQEILNLMKGSLHRTFGEASANPKCSWRL